MVYIRIAVIDRYLWYDTDPTIDDLASWDAITLYLDIDGRDRQIPDSSTYRFVGQLNWWEGRDNYQASYQGSLSRWNIVPLIFSTYSGWRGNAPNDATEDRGWVLNYHIPYSSLGLSGAPVTGTKWRIGFTLHDRDDPAGATRANKYWPENFDSRLVSTGVRNLLVMCPAFVSDCLETLEEIGMRGRETFLEAGGSHFTVIPCLNEHPLWIETLRKMVVEFSEPKSRNRTRSGNASNPE